MGMDTSVRVAHGMTRGRKGRGLRGAIGDTDSRSTSGPDPAAGDIRIVTSIHCQFVIAVSLAISGFGHSTAAESPQPTTNLPHMHGLPPPHGTVILDDIFYR